MKNPDNNTIPESWLTPLELREKRAEANANLVRLMHETMVLTQKLEEVRELEDELPMPLEMLEQLAAEALVGIAQELETRYGISCLLYTSPSPRDS